MEAIEYVEFLYERGEVVVMHPEGTRYDSRVSDKLKMDFVKQAITIGREKGIYIQLIPVGINYHDKKVDVRVGKPIRHNQDNLELRIIEELRALSDM